MCKLFCQSRTFLLPGTDEAAIISVVGYRSNEQMVQVYNAYKTMFGRDLIKDLEGDLSGGFEKLCVGLCLSSAEFDATALNKAIKVCFSNIY